ncbi:S41 family peptidase [Pirellulaceae bacterium]|nr:S41 family peptidase [Pirellulaceae bacterium]
MLCFSKRKRINRQSITKIVMASAVGVCLFVSNGHAQSNARFVSSASISIQPASVIVDILKTGEDLERKGLWGDALTLYERAVKDHNKSKQIQQKLFNARTHYDVHRRYADPNFVKTVISTHPSTAQNMLGELLTKIETHYVDNPEWVALARQGLANLDVALFDTAFRNQYIQDRTEAQVNYAYQRMHQIAQQFRVGTRQNNFDFAVAVANGLYQDLAIPTQATMFEFLNGATTSLDPYSAFLTGDQYADVMSQIDGNFVGLGVEIRPKKDSLQIMSVIPNGPAEKSGLLRGDFINSIEGKLVKEIGGEAAADLLKGPDGSMIGLEINRNGKPIPFRIFRERVDIPSVQDVSIIDRQNGIGMIKLVNFQKTTASDFEKAMWRLHETGMKSLIVDVRGNPGGLLTAAVDVADLFVTNGVLVSTKGRNPREDFIHQARVQGTWNNLPVTVLIDRDSASASEIFAGAISDLRRGTIVGETSYGKGSVQGIFPLQTARGGIRLTTAKFYSPSGTAISDRGVEPDIMVQTTMRPSYDLISDQKETETTEPEDKALKAAISVAKQGLRRSAG